MRSRRFGMRVVQYGLMHNHFHLIVEAEDEESLSSGMAGLKVRIARGLNKVWERSGPVFDDRYHVEPLKWPLQTRNAIAYVLLNARRHLAKKGRVPATAGVDPASSGRWFSGWRSSSPRPRDPPAVAAPTGDDFDALAELAGRDSLVALLIDALAEVCSARDGQIFIAMKLQKVAGDPSPANTVAAERGLTPVNVRKVASRTRERLLRLAGSDARYAGLTTLPLLAP